MATIATIARERKSVLKQLVVLSRKLDARQEALEREILRLTRRKRAVPEIADMQRVLTLADASAIALNELVQGVQSAVGLFRA